MHTLDMDCEDAFFNCHITEAQLRFWQCEMLGACDQVGGPRCRTPETWRQRKLKEHIWGAEKIWSEDVLNML